MKLLTLYAALPALALAAACSQPASEDPPAAEAETAEAAPAEAPEVSGEYDEATVAAAQACHDKVWFEDERFKDLPNAAVSIVEDSLSDDDPAIGWEVEWDDPAVSVSGTCSIDGETMVVTDAS
ncbi:hypothetical protein [Qipengyuania flava]|uniref:hypothetical protein n=1 Tax=Qipengyuania flava TaxID=192812 RepID=UPI001C63B328|nr:hypothetical protein [Qipengyuania flava]QYJ06505.1 hypothetical protein KUV82_10550 [Qipengyuania flava]